MRNRRLSVREQNWRVLVGKIYDYVNNVLWAALCAALIFFAVFVAPNVSAIHAAYQADRIVQNEREYDFYCRRFDMLPVTSRYAHCMSDLAQFRRSIERQVAEESNSLP